MRQYRFHFGLILMVVLIVALAPGQPSHAGVVDDFNDGIWNTDGHWDPDNIMQGLNPDTIAFDETATSGVLTAIALPQLVGLKMVCAWKTYSEANRGTSAFAQSLRGCYGIWSRSGHGGFVSDYPA